MEESQKTRLPLLVLTVILTAVFAIGLRWVFFAAPTTDSAFFYIYDYAVGLTMIFLPCTLPLAFVVVPLAMGKGYIRGIGIAAAFAAGVTITLSFYGALLGAIGQTFLGSAETAKNWMYMFAGAMGLLFAFHDIGLKGIKMPTYGGAFPDFIQKQQEYVKAFLLGLFLGNVGVGCPNPLFNGVIIPQILVSGSAFQGWLIMVVQALGRVTPLFILTFYAILGVNATGFLVKHRTKVEKTTGWAMVFVAGFLFTLGTFTHDWYVYSGIHTYLESVTQEEAITGLLGSNIGQLGHAHELPLGDNLWLGSYVMVTIWLIPFVWIWWKKRKEAHEALEAERAQKVAASRTYLGFVIWLGIGLYTLFGWVLPHNFQFHATHMETAPAFQGVVTTDPLMPRPGELTRITIALKDENGAPLQDLKIEHERLVHVIIVSEDLETFMHVHPDDYGQITDEMRAKGEYPIYVTFPKAGTYSLASGFLHQGHAGTVQNIVTVPGGKPEPVAITKNLMREEKFDDLTVNLKTDPGQIQSGVSAHLEYTMTNDDGTPVNDMVAYLGAPMHLAIWSYDLGYFIHTHGEVPGYGHEVPPDAVFGPLIDVHAAFPYPGLYRAFAQFSRGGDVYTTTFDISVTQGPEGGSMMQGGGGHAH
ncbi:MAG: cytochrome c biogenesis protein CcdA [Patescibacteria group bacterium]